MGKRVKGAGVSERLHHFGSLPLQRIVTGGVVGHGTRIIDVQARLPGEGRHIDHPATEKAIRAQGL
jgi:hypothetical protein